MPGFCRFGPRLRYLLLSPYLLGYSGFGSEVVFGSRWKSGLRVILSKEPDGGQMIGVVLDPELGTRGWRVGRLAGPRLMDVTANAGHEQDPGEPFELDAIGARQQESHGIGTEGVSHGIPSWDNSSHYVGQSEGNTWTRWRRHGSQRT